MTRVCLNMIVKNESARIERCLASVAPHVSCWAIMDTGSTDGTQAAVRDFFGARGIPGHLWGGPFTNFRDTRNAALVGARRLRDDLAWDYLLLCDADMELMAPDGIGELTAPGYQMLQRSGGIEYWNARITRLDNTSNYIGITHEYLNTKFPLEKLHGSWFIDHSDGANRPGKIERDIAWLSAEVERDPFDARSWFYLGNSFKELGRHEEAIEAYQKRIALGGWDEEVYAALLYASRSARAMECSS
jgi:glycosyltransferase involved in cell wall biosynthesis